MMNIKPFKDYQGEAIFDRISSRLQLEYWGYFANSFVVDQQPV